MNKFSKYKIPFFVCFMLFILSLNTIWFGHDQTVDSVKGLKFVGNPFIATGIFLSLVFIVKNKSIKWGLTANLLIIMGLIHVFFTWFFPAIGKDYSFIHSYNTAYIGFYVSLFIELFSLFVYCGLMIFKHTRNNNNYRISKYMG